MTKKEITSETYLFYFKMVTKQNIVTLRKEIGERRNENKEYEKELIALRKKKPRDEDTIKFNEKKIFANDWQIIEKEKQITELTKKQGKITAPPIYYIFRQIIY